MWEIIGNLFILVYTILITIYLVNWFFNRYLKPGTYIINCIVKAKEPKTMYRHAVKAEDKLMFIIRSPIKLGEENDKFEVSWINFLTFSPLFKIE